MPLCILFRQIEQHEVESPLHLVAEQVRHVRVLLALLVASLLKEMLHEWLATDTLTQLLFDCSHFRTFADVLENSYELSSCLDAFKLLRLPDLVAKQELTFLKISDFILSKVLFSLLHFSF